MDTIQVVGEVQDSRAEAVRARLTEIKNSSDDNFFEMCELLLEAQEKALHQHWGFARFGDWIEVASGLDMSARQAYYYVGIAKKALDLGLVREDLLKAKISKLKEIFTLDPQEHADDMRQLVADAPIWTLDEIKEKVRDLKGDSEENEFGHITIKYPLSAKPVIDEAFELAKRLRGDTTLHGDAVEPSNGQVLEDICADFISGNREDTAA
jgi:hypothetical protein